MTTTLRLLVPVFALSLAACGSSDSSATKTVTETATVTKSPSAEVVPDEMGVPPEGEAASPDGAAMTPRNPVEVAGKIPGCDLGGASSGEVDINGDRYVSCVMDGVQEVTTYTYLGDPRMVDPEAVTPDDSTYVIVGDDFVIRYYYPEGIAEDDVKAHAEAVEGEAVLP